MRVLVCGGRKFSDAALLNRTLDAAHASGPIKLVIHGTARGADTLAEKWAFAHDVPVEPYQPDWDRHGTMAGHIRNGRMLKEGKPELVIAFPGGRGTRNMVAQAREAGVPVKVIDG